MAANDFEDDRRRHFEATRERRHRASAAPTKNDFRSMLPLQQTPERQPINNNKKRENAKKLTSYVELTIQFVFLSQCPPSISKSVNIKDPLTLSSVSECFTEQCKATCKIKERFF